MLTLCEVAALAREIGMKTSHPDFVQRSTSVTQFGISRAEFDGMFRSSDNDDGSATSKNVTSVPNESSYQGRYIIDPTYSDPRRGTLDPSQKSKINELLGAWYDRIIILKIVLLMRAVLNLLVDLLYIF